MHPRVRKDQIEKRELRCLNCHQPLAPSDNFCPQCGQVNRPPRQSVSDWIREFFASFLSVDSKFIHSLIPLLFQPGKLSEDYVSGKRARYIHPIRLYLAVSILMFFVFSLDSDRENRIKFSGADTDTTTTADDHLDLVLTDGDTSGWWFEKEMIEEYYKAHQDADWEEVLRNTGIENTMANRFFYSELAKAYNMDVNSFFQYYYRKTPVILFLFLPFFTLWLKVLYLNRDILYTEHLIFAFHTQTSLFALLLLTYLISMILNSSIVGVALLLFAIYLYIALKRFYKQNHFLTVLKYILLNSGFIILSIMFVILGSLTLFLLY